MFPTSSALDVVFSFETTNYPCGVPSRRIRIRIAFNNARDRESGLYPLQLLLVVGEYSTVSATVTVTFIVCVAGWMGLRASHRMTPVGTRWDTCFCYMACKWKHNNKFPVMFGCILLSSRHERIMCNKRGDSRIYLGKEGFMIGYLAGIEERRTSRRWGLSVMQSDVSTVSLG